MPKPPFNDPHAAAAPQVPFTANALVGIGLKVASVCTLVFMSSMLKATGTLPPGQLVFFRSAFAIFPIVLFLAVRGELASALKTAHPFGQLARGLVGVTAMSLTFFALTHLPLPEAISISYAAPLLLVVFGAVFLKETVRLYRWSAVIVGLAGVIVVTWPRLTLLSGGDPPDAQSAIGAVAALAAAVFAAVAGLLVRGLVQTERSSTIVLYFSLIASVLALFTLPFGWPALTPMQLVLLIGAGVFGGVGQILLTESYRHADVSIIAPFEYTSMILGIAIGYFIFGEVPTVQMLIGGAIVVAAGIFVILRESRLGLPRGPARRVYTNQG